MNSIFTRRSIRKYTDRKVSEELIEQILRAGMAAPSANNKQPWHFILIDKRKSLDEITTVHPYAQMLKQASHAIIVCGDRSLQSNDYWVQDCSAAMQNMLLMAQELGLGAVWLGVYPREDRVKGLKALMDIPENVMPLSVMSLGYPAETKQPEDRYNPSRVHMNKW